MNNPTLHLPCEEPRASRADTGAGDALMVLARVCARTQGSGIDALVADRSVWAALFDVATAHSVAPLFCTRLSGLAGNGLPANWRERLREEFIANVHRNLFLTAELIRVLRALEGNGVQAIPFKGPVLAEQAYGDLALRNFCDLDIVLPHLQLGEAHRAMENLGYRSDGAAAAMAEDRIPGQYAYRSNARATLVELHTEKTMRYLPVPLHWKSLSQRFEMISVGGQPLRTFSIEDTLTLVCVHGTKHFWTRLGWICDVAELLQAPRGIDWQQAEAIARKMQCHRMWLLGLALANQLLAAPLPPSVTRQIQSDARVPELARCVREQYLRGGESSISAGERLRFRAHSQDTLATSLRQISIFATRPTDEDWQSYSLPRWAAPLYAVLRPLRILRGAKKSAS